MRKIKGFTLIELMITLAILAIVLAIAIPSYSNYVRKAKRGEAQEAMLDWANRQEICRANQPTYNSANCTNVGAPSVDDYNITIGNVSATDYTITATATGNQTQDKQAGASCATMTLNQSGIKGPSGSEACWGD